MEASSLIQIFKTGDVVDKEYEGRKYQVQECECALLDNHGAFVSVGVLRLSPDFRKSPPAPGTYTATFTLTASPKDRRIGAVVTGLVAVVPRASSASKA